MLSLHTNAASLSTQNSLGSTNKALSTSMTRLGTGFRVNSAMDDAAGLQIATRLNAQSRGMTVAQKNTQNAISMLQTAEGALSEMTNITLRMKDLAIERENGTTTADDKTAINAELDALGLEVKNIIENTRFGGEELFLTTGLATTDLKYQIGDQDGDQMASSVDVSTVAAYIDWDNTESIDSLNTALKDISELRSAIGADANRLQHTHTNLGNMIQNTKAAEGRIMDVDYATETSNMTSKQMLMQASTSMLKQSNSMSQMVASLLQ